MLKVAQHVQDLKSYRSYTILDREMGGQMDWQAPMADEGKTMQAGIKTFQWWC